MELLLALAFKVCDPVPLPLLSFIVVGPLPSATKTKDVMAELLLDPFPSSSGLFWVDVFIGSEDRALSPGDMVSES